MYLFLNLNRLTIYISVYIPKSSCNYSLCIMYSQLGGYSKLSCQKLFSNLPEGFTVLFRHQYFMSYNSIKNFFCVYNVFQLQPQSTAVSAKQIFCLENFIMGLENSLQLKLVPHPEHPEKNNSFPCFSFIQETYLATC